MIPNQILEKLKIYTEPLNLNHYEKTTKLANIVSVTSKLKTVTIDKVILD